ncbi:MAG TPA: glutamyl-tRNA reductase [Actinomycetes bacterium]|nr:glutamyl-tRNA reductase [Actinomycetes bacterium]
MSILVVGISHRTAPVALLERVALDADGVAKLTLDVAASPHIDEVVALATCNRVELYLGVERFHAALFDATELLARHTGIAVDELTAHLYVHYENRAVHHLFSVACGLDSMVVGEPQILGQLRTVLRAAQDGGTAGRVLHELFQQALRVGKRAHTETGIDRAGASLVGVALDLAAPALDGLAGRSALVVGAGSMSALSAATLGRYGVREIVVANRTYARAEQLAASVDGSAVALDGLLDAMAGVDIVVTCTGAVGTVITADLVARAQARRSDRPLVVLDLALPHDVDPDVRRVPGVVVIDLARLAEVLAPAQHGDDLAAVRAIVTAETTAFAGWSQAAGVTPTVVALRSRAADVVDAELTRLAGRLPDLDAGSREEVAQTVRRVVDKLLHAPTVRMKELATAPGGDTYAQLLRQLFDLDARGVEQVRLPPSSEHDGD